MSSLALTLTSVCIAGALWHTRHWGRSRWRWIVWPQVALVLTITQIAYIGGLPVELLRWPGADKALHFLLFGLVAFAANLWLGGRRLKIGRWALPLAIVIPLAAATVEEILQGLSPNRTSDVFDWLSNLAGMVVFWRLSQLMLTRDERPGDEIAGL